jgi:hypothetical protein
MMDEEEEFLQFEANALDWYFAGFWEAEEDDE